MAKRNPKQMIVEGDDDLYSVVGLMSAHINWPDGRENAPVRIKAAGGADQILVAGYIAVELKTTNVKLGIVLDADTNPRGRYESIRNLCAGVFPGLPREMPAEGQDPPGQSGGRALTQHILDSHSPSSAAFVKWFRDLYQI